MTGLGQHPSYPAFRRESGTATSCRLTSSDGADGPQQGSHNLAHGLTLG
jgi:hypothetical protein